MATIVNNPDGNGASGWIVAVVVLVVLLLIALFVWPGLARENTTVQETPNEGVNGNNGDNGNILPPVINTFNSTTTVTSTTTED